MTIALIAVISLDYSDEHYRISCPRCVQQLFVVIGEYGHYWRCGTETMATFNAYPSGRPTRQPWQASRTGCAMANGELMLANGLT